MLTYNEEVAGCSAPVRVVTGNKSNRSYEFIFREFKMLKGETVRRVVSKSRFDLYSSVTSKTGRTFNFVSPLFSATSFFICAGKIPLFWLRNLLRRFNFSLRRFFCGLSSVTSLTLSAAFVLDAAIFFKMVFAGGGLEAGNSGLFGNVTIGLTKDTASDVFAGSGLEAGNSDLFGNVTIGLTKDTASDVSTGFIFFKPAVSPSTPLFDDELKDAIAFVGFTSTLSALFCFGFSCDSC